MRTAAAHLDSRPSPLPVRARALVLLSAACFLALPTSPSRASTTYDLTMVGVSGSGFITFDTTTFGFASTDPSSVIDFSLSGTGLLGPFVFDEASVGSPIDWSIDPSTWELTLSVLTVFGTTTSGITSCIGTGGVAGCGFGSVDIFGNPFGLAQTVAGSGASSGTAFSLIATVPEPGPVAFLASVLPGLAWLARRGRPRLQPLG